MVFFFQYMLYVVACFLLFAGTGVLALFTTLEWNDILDRTVAGSFATTVENIRNSLAATSVSEHNEPVAPNSPTACLWNRLGSKTN